MRLFYGLLKCKYSCVEYAQIKKEYLYDLKKHHGEVEDCIIFGVTCITGRAILMACDYGKRCNLLSPPYYLRLFNVVLNQKCSESRLDELQLWNSFSYYPAVTTWDILESQSGKYIGKDKNGTTVDIYLPLTLHIQNLIYLTLIIQRFRTNISALTYLR